MPFAGGSVLAILEKETEFPLAAKAAADLRLRAPVEEARTAAEFEPPRPLI
jgi:hypothetical protein